MDALGNRHPNLFVRHPKSERNHQVEHQIRMGRSWHNAEIMQTQLRVKLAYQ